MNAWWLRFAAILGTVLVFAGFFGFLYRPRMAEIVAFERQAAEARRAGEELIGRLGDHDTAVDARDRAESAAARIRAAFASDSAAIEARVREAVLQVGAEVTSLQLGAAARRGPLARRDILVEALGDSGAAFALAEALGLLGEHLALRDLRVDRAPDAPGRLRVRAVVTAISFPPPQPPAPARGAGSARRQS